MWVASERIPPQMRPATRGEESAQSIQSPSMGCFVGPSGRNRGGRTISPALRAGRAFARIPENQLAVSPPFPRSSKELAYLPDLVLIVAGVTLLN